jgi:hypothetical protein
MRRSVPAALFFIFAAGACADEPDALQAAAKGLEQLKALRSARIEYSAQAVLPGADPAEIHGEGLLQAPDLMALRVKGLVPKGEVDLFVKGEKAAARDPRDDSWAGIRRGPFASLAPAVRSPHALLQAVLAHARSAEYSGWERVNQRQCRCVRIALENDAVLPLLAAAGIKPAGVAWDNSRVFAQIWLDVDTLVPRKFLVTMNLSIAAEQPAAEAEDEGEERRSRSGFFARGTTSEGGKKPEPKARRLMFTAEVAFSDHDAAPRIEVPEQAAEIFRRPE